tara:strand:+ start:339 stop:593 length:255 start_codon:yes stop_codon:yes gene_type:complete
LSYFNPSHLFECFGVTLCAVAHDEAVFAVRGELAGDVFRVVNMWFRNSLYAARGFSVSGVKDFAASSVDSGDDQSVGKSGGKRC